MTIEDNIDFLNEAKKLFEDIANNPSINETVKAYFIIESLESAIETMRKFKQIKQIFDMWNDFKYEDDDVLAMISDMVYKGDDIK